MVLLGGNEVRIAMLRFTERATIHEHAAEIEVDVICLCGRGMTRVGDDTKGIEAGQRVDGRPACATGSGPTVTR